MANMATEFESWLKAKGVKNFTPSFCVAIIDKVSKYSAEKNTLQAFVKSPTGIFAITDWKLFNQLRAKLAGDKVFRMIDKQTYKAFDKVGNYYTQFLKDVESGRFELSVEVAEDTEESSSQIESRGRTISEAAIEVLKQSQPRTIKQIYEIIVKQNLYVFKAAQPLGVLASEIRSRCEGVELPSRQGMFPSKSFRLAGVVMGEQLYALADADDKRKEDSQTTALEWNDAVAEEFKRFLLASSKAEGTAQSYKSNMGWVVRNFSEQWAEAQKKETDTKGIFYFIAAVSSDERFKAANITAHNQYSAAMNQFLNYINNRGMVVTDTTHGKVSRRSSKKERAVGSAKILDWGNLESLEFTKPFSIKIQGFSKTEDKVIPISSWKQVLRKLARIIFSEGIDIDLTDFTYSKSKRVIFGFGEESVDYAKTVCEERDFWVCLNWSADNSVGICKELMDYCDISYDSIEVSYIEGDSSMDAREVEVTIDINKIAIKEKKVIDFIGEHFKSGVRLEALEIADVVARLNQVEFDYESEEHLKRILRNNLFEIEGRYFHINSLLIGVSIEEILETLKGFSESQATALFMGLSAGKLEESKESFNAHCLKAIDDFKAGLGSQKLRELFKQNSGHNSPREWSNVNRTPILACIPAQEKASAKEVFAVFDESIPSKVQIDNALAYLQKASWWSIVSDRRMVEIKFTERIIGKYKGVVTPNEVRDHLQKVGIEPYQWSEDVEVREEIIKLASKSYATNGAKKAVSKIESFSDLAELKKYLKKLIEENIEVGVSVLDEE